MNKNKHIQQSCTAIYPWRRVLALAVLGAATLMAVVSVQAQSWGVVGTVSGTLASGRMCFTDGTDILCTTAAPQYNTGTGTLTATRFVGDGASLTNINADAISDLNLNAIVNGTTSITIPSANGAIGFDVNGSRRATLSTSGAFAVGTDSAPLENFQVGTGYALRLGGTGRVIGYYNSEWDEVDNRNEFLGYTGGSKYAARSEFNVVDGVWNFQISNAAGAAGDVVDFRSALQLHPTGVVIAPTEVSTTILRLGSNRGTASNPWPGSSNTDYAVALQRANFIDYVRTYTGTSIWNMHTGSFGSTHRWSRGSADGNQRIMQLNGTDGNQHLSLYDGTTDLEDIRLSTTGDSWLNGGNVGIGTSTPATSLTVIGAVSATTFFGDGSGLTGIGSADAIVNGTTSITIPTSNGAINFDTNGSHRMTILANGNVGIGATNPNAELEIAGTASATNVHVGGSLMLAGVAGGAGLDNTISELSWTALTDIPAGVSNIATTPLETTELTQLQNIDATTVSAAQWGYVGGLDQALATADDVTFNSISGDGSALTGITADSAAIAQAVNWVSVTSVPQSVLDLAGLNATDSSIMVGNGTNFVLESGATARTSLGLGIGDDVSFSSLTTTARADIGSAVSVTGAVQAASFIGDGSGLTGVAAGSADWYSLTSIPTGVANISTTALTTTELGFLQGTDQALATTDDVTFNNIATTTRLDVGSNISVTGTVQAANFVGDGSGLTNINASNISGDIAASSLVNGTTSITIPSANGEISFDTNGNRRMTVLANGNIGVGTLAPMTQLHISALGAGDNALRLSRASYDNVYLQISPPTGLPLPNNAKITVSDLSGSNTEDAILIAGYSSGSVKLGNVGIQNTGGQNYVALQVSGTIAISNGGEACDADRTGGLRYLSGNVQFCDGSSGWRDLAAADSISTNAIVNGTTSITIPSANGAVNVDTNGNRAMTVLANGNVGIGTASPLDNLQVQQSGGVTMTLAAMADQENVSLFMLEQYNSLGNNATGFEAFYDGTANDYQLIPWTSGTRGAPALTIDRDTSHVAVGGIDDAGAATEALTVSGTLQVRRTGRGWWNIGSATNENALVFTHVGMGEVVRIRGNAGGLTVSGTVDATGFVGDGSGLTGIAASTASSLVNGTSSITIPSANGEIRFDTAGSRRMIMDTSGNLALGDNTPVGGKLSVNGSAGGTSLYLTDSVNSTLAIKHESPNNLLTYEVFGTAQQRWVNNGVERMRITNTGNIGISTTTPGYKLHVNGVAAGTAWVNLSDRNLKTNINDLARNEALDSVLRLRGVTFEWKEPGSVHQKGTKVGFIAQEVEEVLPEVVTTADDGTKSVDYVAVIPLLVEALKAQQAQIDALKAEIKNLR